MLKRTKKLDDVGNFGHARIKRVPFVRIESWQRFPFLKERFPFLSRKEGERGLLNSREEKLIKFATSGRFSREAFAGRIMAGIEVSDDRSPTEVATFIRRME